MLEFASCSTRSAASPVLVVTFLALLELAREQLIEITQAEGFAPIYVKLAYAAVRLKSKRILEAALLAAPEPLPPRRAQALVRRRDRRRHAAQPARRAARRTGRAARSSWCTVASGWRFQTRRRVPAVSRPAVARKAAALLARGDGDARDHRLPPAGHARRHRGHPRRRGLDARSSRRSRTAAGSTSSATARRPAGRRSTRRRASSSTTSACARSRSCRRSRRSPRPSSLSPCPTAEASEAAAPRRRATTSRSAATGTDG